MSYSSEVLADSPLAYWRLGEDANYGTATSSTNFVSEPPANAFDGLATTYWTTNGVSSGWLRNQLSAGHVATGYTIRRRDDIPGRNPKDWTFEGSNDGSTWTTLDTQAGITWSTVGETKSFTFTNTTSYSYYRLNITANNGDTYLSVAELTISGLGIVDSSGNAHAGSYTSTVTLAVTGALTGDSNTAATFNGTSSHGDVAYASWAAVTSALTVEAWVKTSATGVRSFFDRDSNGSRAFQFRQNGGSLEFVKIAGGVVTASQATSIDDGAWHHVAATYDGSNIRLYKDGSLINTTAATGSMAATDPFTIGANQSSGYAAFWSGQLDELAYYNTTLSGTRIAAHYAAGTTSSTAASGTASLSLSGSGAAPAPTSASASLTISAAGSASGGASASASLALSAAGTAHATQAASGSGSLALSASGSATLATTATASLDLSASGVVEVLYLTDTSNLLNGRRRHARATATVTRPVGASPSGLGVRYDKAVPYPPPTLVNGRPT